MTFFCPLPFTELHCNFDGKAAPCCAFTGKAVISLSDYTKNEQLREVKQQLLKGEAPHQCRACVFQEKTSGDSFRTVALKFHSEKSLEIQRINDADYFDLQKVFVLTSNVCNLKCLPCTGGASTARQFELAKIGLNDSIPRIEKLADFESIADLDFKEITFTGGEPFYDKVTFDCLQHLINKGKSHDLHVTLNSNMTAITHNQLDFLSTNFRGVMIKASIDGFGKVNDYLRYPSRWEVIQQNIDSVKHKNIEMVVTTALSNLSLIKYHELLTWAVQNNLNLFITQVLDPDVLDPRLLPKQLHNELQQRFVELKKDLGDKMLDRTVHCVDTCIKICQSNDYNEQSFKSFREWINKHDQHRGTTMIDVFPELIAYM